MGFLFEDLRVYKAAMEFVIKIYTLEGNPDKSIKDQLRRAALSIPLNIAEGQGRHHDKEKRQFYNTAKGSLYECLPIIQLCLAIKHINNDQYAQLYQLINDIGKMLNGLINSVGTKKEHRD